MVTSSLRINLLFVVDLPFKMNEPDTSKCSLQERGDTPNKPPTKSPALQIRTQNSRMQSSSKGQIIFVFSVSQSNVK
jgi:hypothetical protein